MSRRLLPLALLLALLVACGGEASPWKPLRPQEILTRAGQAMARLESFHFQLKHEGGGTPIMTGLTLEEVEGDVVRPGRMKARLGVIASGIGFISLELITIGETTYMGGLFPGRWAEQPASVSPAGFFDPDAGMKAILTSLTEVLLLPDGEVAGVPAYRLRGRVASEVLKPVVGNPVPGASIEAEAWIGKEDYLVRRLILQGRLVAGDGEGISRTIGVSGFNQPVTIEPPLIAP